MENFHDSTLGDLSFNGSCLRLTVRAPLTAADNHAFDQLFLDLEQSECATLQAEPEQNGFGIFSSYPLNSPLLEQGSSNDVLAACSSVEDFADLLNTPSSAQSPWPDQGSQSGYFLSSAPDSLSSSQDQYATGVSTQPAQGTNDHEFLASLQQHIAPPGRTRPGLPRRRSRYMLNRSQLQAEPTFIPNASTLDPLQRWQESPPEDEPASLTAIMNAMEKSDALNNTSNAFSHHRRPASLTSAESSASSTDSAWSSASQSARRGSRRRLRTGVSKTKTIDTNPRRFCCTFCCDRFKTRYEWLRHEKSLHLNLEAWYCAPLGPSVYSPITGRSHCAYCNALDPSHEHLATHNHDACQTLSKEARSFHRKDHLVQHLRRFHHLQTIPLIDDWKIETKDITSRCGFCDIRLSNWDERIDHLARHFRRGSTMKEWKGDHDFPPAVAARLKNAFPPYLLGWESERFIPFSATSAEVRDQYAQVTARFQELTGGGNAPEAETRAPETERASGDRNLQFDTFMESFTRHLSRYARAQMQNGIVPTDEMFQQESRRILFDTHDAWDQTIADNPEWLSSFRQLHCGSGDDPDRAE